MKTNQISVFIENKPGHLAAVCKCLSENGINIRALSLAESSDYGILRVIVDDPERALVVFKENEFTAGLTDVVTVELEDDPGALTKVLTLLDEQGVNVEYMSAFLKRTGHKALVVMRFDDTETAIDVLSKGGISVIKETDL